MHFVMDSYMEELSKEEINKKISIFNLKLADKSIEEVKSFYDEKVVKQDEPIEIYYAKNTKYIFFPHKEPPFFKNKKNILNKFPRPPLPFLGTPFKMDILLIDELNEDRFKYLWLVVLFFIDILLVWFFLFIKEKLIPLKNLKKDVIKFANGDLYVSTKTQGKDEISQVANEFDKAIKQLRELRESRNLFLRNIMHELKTPITKGKLIGDILEESERKEILIKIFNRLEYLLSEFSRIEELTSGKIELNKNNYRVIDIIEQAFDILLLDENRVKVEHCSNLLIEVDYELFSIALKNLIDNALEYNTNSNPEIKIDSNSITIKNKGERLKKDINEYFKPFNHDYESSNKGLGLGLYITNSIIKIHNFDLLYKYENGNHYFIIIVK